MKFERALAREKPIGREKNFTSSWSVKRHHWRDFRREMTWPWVRTPPQHLASDVPLGKSLISQSLHLGPTCLWPPINKEIMYSIQEQEPNPWVKQAYGRCDIIVTAPGFFLGGRDCSCLWRPLATSHTSHSLSTYLSISLSSSSIITSSPSACF